MSTVKKGLLVKDGEWRKHLRRWGKKVFWRKHRAAERELVREEAQ